MSSPGTPDFVLAPARRGRDGRSVTASQAMAAIPDDARVYVSPICAVPTDLIDAMVEARHRWSRIELITDYLVEPLAVFEYAGEPFVMTSMQPSRAVNAMRDAGVLRTVPASYSQYAGLIAADGPLPLDVMIVQVSSPGPDGRFSLGASVGATVEALRTTPLVIAEVNPQMPYTFGAGECHRDEFDLLVDVDHPLVELTVPPPDDIALAIANHAASQIRDGSTLQFGIGAIPEAILAVLADRHDLGIHGGMVSDAVVDLAEAGAVTGVRKNNDAGLMVVAALIGSNKCFAWADRNPAIFTVPGSYSHGIAALSRIENFVAINSALEIAADGAVNAEQARGRVLSGPGGQPDFAIGAAASPSGSSFIALPSTAARGTASRIVRALPPGISATVPRYLIDMIVTEYGIAHLRGLPIEDRLNALAEIAHPDFRGELID